MNTGPGTTNRPPLSEKQQKRVAMLQKFAGTPQQRRNTRYVRPLLVLFLGGIAFVLGGFMTYNQGETEMRHDSWLYQQFGARGSFVLMEIFGIAMLIGGVLLLRKIMRDNKAEAAQRSRA